MKYLFDELLIAINFLVFVKGKKKLFDFSKVLDQ